MYRISYEKCVCFIFLVILAVLSCSGFRIDNLAMTDISKRNSHTSSSLLNSNQFFDKLFSVNATAPTFRHRIRHHRQLRAQAHTPQPNEHFAQIPSTDLHPNPLLPTKSLRSQRSNDRRGNKKFNLCPDHDVSWKAYKANAIVIAKVESKSTKCRESCTVLFKVVKTLKRSTFPIDELVGLKFPNNKTAGNCDSDDLSNRSQFLVRTKSDQIKEYILFLNTSGAHNFTAVFMPEISRNRTLNIINRVIRPSFKPRQLKLQKVDFPKKSENRSKLKLACRVKGFPIPTIYWKRNNTLLHPNQHRRFTQKKRKGTLVIRNFTEADSGSYQCIVRGVDGNEMSLWYNVRPPSEQPIFTRYDDRRQCDELMKTGYCMNGGRCFFIQSLGEMMCQCDEGYSGLRCETKTSDQSSMYRQTPIYTCNIGLYTKYDNC